VQGSDLAQHSPRTNRLVEANLLGSWVGFESL